MTKRVEDFNGDLDEDLGKHTLTTRNWPRMWENTLWRHEMYLGSGGTPSTDRKSTRDVVEQTLPTGNQPWTWRNTLCWPKIDREHGGTHSTDRKSTLDVGGTHSADRKSTLDVAEHPLPTGNRPGTWRNTLCRPEIDLGRGGTYFLISP